MRFRPPTPIIGFVSHRGHSKFAAVQVGFFGPRAGVAAALRRLAPRLLRRKEAPLFGL